MINKKRRLKPFLSIFITIMLALILVSCQVIPEVFSELEYTADYDEVSDETTFNWSSKLEIRYYQRDLKAFDITFRVFNDDVFQTLHTVSYTKTYQINDHNTIVHTFKMDGEFYEIRIENYKLYFYDYFTTFSDEILFSSLAVGVFILVLVILASFVPMPKALLTSFQIIMFIAWGFIGLDILIKAFVYVFSKKIGLQELELVRNMLILMAFTVFVTVKKSLTVNKRIA